MSTNHTARLALAENIKIPMMSQNVDIPVTRFVGPEEKTMPSSLAASCEDTEKTDFVAFMRDLDELMRDSGPNKNERAINLITACIERGFDTRL